MILGFGMAPIGRQDILTASPSPRYDALTAFDEAHKVLFLFGGYAHVEKQYAQSHSMTFGPGMEASGLRLCHLWRIEMIILAL